MWLCLTLSVLPTLTALAGLYIPPRPSSMFSFPPFSSSYLPWREKGGSRLLILRVGGPALHIVVACRLLSMPRVSQSPEFLMFFSFSLCSSLDVVTRGRWLRRFC